METTAAPGTLTALMAELVAPPSIAQAPTEGAPLVPGQRVGKFEILKEVGRGGFGVVYEARDLELGRSVAFKALRPGPGARLDASLLAEAEVAARFSHPNIVQLHDYGRWEGGGFLILELLRGEPLSGRLAAGRLPLQEAVSIARDVARALAHAHAEGVVHRDLKPGNVFVTEDGTVKVLDFGLALVLGRTSSWGATPAYASPEQMRGEPGNARSDVFALGVMLHELLAGDRPFASDTQDRGLTADARLPALRDAPAPLVRLVGRMLARDPATRPDDGAAVLAALEPIHAALQPIRKVVRLAWSAAALALGVALAAVFWPRPPPLPPGRLTVALSDVANASGEPLLDDVGELLAKSLEQSPRVSLLARSRLLGLAGDNGKLLEARARHAARQARANVLLAVAARRAPDGLELAVSGEEVFQERPLFRVAEIAPTVAAIPAVLDRVSERIRRALHEPEGTPPPAALAQVVSSNPEAWRLYAEGRRLLSEAHRGEATNAFRRAVALDPQFPLPHVELALVDQWNDRDATEQHAAAALLHPERLPPLERRLVDLAVAIVRWDFNVARERVDGLVADYPDALEPRRVGGPFLLLAFGDLEAARPHYERLFGQGLLHPLDELVARLRFRGADDALSFAERRVRDDPDRALSHLLRSQARRANRDVGGALEAAREAVARGAKPGWPQLFWAYAEAGALQEVEGDGSPLGRYLLAATHGRRREALAAFDALAPGPGAPTFRRGYHHNLRMDALGPFSDAEALWREVQAQFDLTCGAISCSAIALARAGAFGRVHQLYQLFPHGPETSCYRVSRAFEAWRSRGPEAGLAILEGLAFDQDELYRGEMLLELGRNRDAIAALRRWRSGLVPDNDLAFYAAWAWPRSLLLEATALEREGDRDGARTVLARVEKLWAHADADLPWLADARELRARLGAP